MLTTRATFGNFGIRMSVSRHQYFFCLTNFFFRKNGIFVFNTPQYSFLCLVIRHKYYFATVTDFSTISHSSIQERPIVFWKKAVWVFRSTRPLLFQKNSCSQNFSKFLSKTFMTESYLSTLSGRSRSFVKSCFEQVFCERLLL